MSITLAKSAASKAMKYPISILFLLTIIVAIETAVFSRVEWPMLVLIGLGILLIWVKLGDCLRYKTGELSISDNLEQPVHNAIVETSSSKFVSRCLFVAATVLLASSLTNSHPKYSHKPYRKWFNTLLSLATLIAFGFSLDIGLWFVYFACKGIELSLFDPYHILEAPQILHFGEAVWKSLLGVTGFMAWFTVGGFTYRKVRKESTIQLGVVWLASGLACSATIALWLFLLNDFPQLDEATDAILLQPLPWNTLLVVLLAVTGFIQYCTIAPAIRYPEIDRSRMWQNRVLGLLMLIPALLIVVPNLIKLTQLWISDFDLEMMFSLVFVLTDLLSNESIMLIALLILGFRTISSAKDGPVRYRSVPLPMLIQITFIACLLIVSLPIHLSISMFYFDAVLTLTPGF